MLSMDSAETCFPIGSDSGLCGVSLSRLARSVVRTLRLFATGLLFVTCSYEACLLQGRLGWQPFVAPLGTRALVTVRGLLFLMRWCPELVAKFAVLLCASLQIRTFVFSCLVDVLLCNADWLCSAA